ncbi:hypothetical protein [Hyphomicrobium sp. ghe19]|uniref:hypothetical protein n=1 Tax=Hyphomicrobium sp. ghe19 TaxID=2682968 RepID=UPI0013669C1F|nr:hypothetical protein HYPP_03811 [Hyphomicrobium sp. ghe19]
MPDDNNKTSTDFVMSKGIAPFADGSGFQWRVEVRRDGATARVLIFEGKECWINIPVERWSEISGAARGMIEFMSNTIQSKPDSTTSKADQNGEG